MHTLGGALLAVAACAGCDRPAGQRSPEPRQTGRAAPTVQPATPPSAVPEPPAPPRDATGPTGVLETYYALIGARRYDEARRLRWDHDTLDAKAFAANFEPYAVYRATVGAPSEVQGAAGSLYVEVPVQLYGTLKTGKPFGTVGTITLRRVNDVPGASAEERRWRIYTSD